MKLSVNVVQTQCGLKKGTQKGKKLMLIMLSQKMVNMNNLNHENELLANLQAGS